MSLLSRTSWSSTPCPPSLLPRYKSQVYQTTWFSPQTVDVLNHVSTFSRQTSVCTKPHGYTQPINCYFISQKDTMIPYVAQTRHLLNSQVLAIFPPSATTSATHQSGSDNSPNFLPLTTLGKARNLPQILRKS